MGRIKVMAMIDRPFLGGGQVNLLALARNLDRTEFEVSVCSQPGGALEEEVRKSNIDFFPISFQKKNWIKVVRQIRLLLEQKEVNILHTHGGVAGLFGRWAGRRIKNLILIHSLHGIHYLHYRNPLLKAGACWLERYFSSFTDQVICVSEGDRQKAIDYKLVPEEKVTVIHNGLDFDTFNKVNNRVNKKIPFYLKPSSPVVGSVARLHRQKGLIYLLQAVPQIAKVFPEVKILIIGGGPLGAKLSRQAAKLGLGKIVSFLGERQDAAHLLSTFDVFVLPSLWEGFPYVLLEAAAMAKPVVATRVSGSTEIIKDKKTGILVPPRRPDKLAQAVIKLLQQREYAQNLGQSLKKNICQRFTLSQMVGRIQKLYLRLYQKKQKEEPSPLSPPIDN